MTAGRNFTHIPSTRSWLESRPHRLWLAAEGRQLLDFSKNARLEHGFGPLDGKGRLAEDSVADTILTARMTHAYGLAALQGLPGCGALAQHGVDCLRGPLRDARHGGWMPDEKHPDDRKQAYLHAFVALAGSTAVVLGLEGGQALLDDAISVLNAHFWCEKDGVMRESFATDWSDEEDYRGANSNMHSTEMCMALADVTGDPVWLERALRIVTRFIHTYAKAERYAVPEHFNRNWDMLRDYDRDKPTDSLRPFGMTPGHFAEWSHLVLKLEAALLLRGIPAPEWMLDDARGLFDQAVRSGWHVDETPGLIYTIDWDHKPHVRVRAHWVQAEAITAALSLFRRTGAAEYEGWYRRIWDYVDRFCIDRVEGSWFNEVDPKGHVSEEIYPGKADLYHAYQATLAPVLPLAPSLATAIAQGALDDQI
ncbi:D-mannose isomerase [Tanticharoenia sakaeratensis]|uniref:Isomerase n=1 Tax=Tanticharoenia sakaeratensis NBRC 103193 TaxID=1231623 RepID=A0A0D6MK31_9PROT|nr:AGE family epimerase/isomerase [Tanticharoenia sakaeratensis]GAN53795.1 isomerase [Tanticharoenia sakaeratensis NBRC 103193]GBQ22345.1 N-acylglucosamine 2-epimerase [Tanticharoenia sakaeratensis NBRC 103193]